jgi:hypothetical protein
VSVLAGIRICRDPVFFDPCVRRFPCADADDSIGDRCTAYIVDPLLSITDNIRFIAVLSDLMDTDQPLVPWILSAGRVAQKVHGSAQQDDAGCIVCIFVMV